MKGTITDHNEKTYEQGCTLDMVGECIMSSSKVLKKKQTRFSTFTIVSFTNENNNDINFEGDNSDSKIIVSDPSLPAFPSSAPSSLIYDGILVQSLIDNSELSKNGKKWQPIVTVQVKHSLGTDLTDVTVLGYFTDEKGKTKKKECLLDNDGICTLTFSKLKVSLVLESTFYISNIFDREGEYKFKAADGSATQITLKAP